MTPEFTHGLAVGLVFGAIAGAVLVVAIGAVLAAREADDDIRTLAARHRYQPRLEQISAANVRRHGAKREKPDSPRGA
jgi:hypothetical protein